jgi:hypothetical protein
MRPWHFFLDLGLQLTALHNKEAICPAAIKSAVDPKVMPKDIVPCHRVLFEKADIYIYEKYKNRSTFISCGGWVDEAEPLVTGIIQQNSDWLPL